jgi:hypothetical protein
LKRLSRRNPDRLGSASGACHLEDSVFKDGMAIYDSEEAQDIELIPGFERRLLIALNAESARGIRQVRRTVGHVKSYNTAHMNAMARWLIESETLEVRQGTHGQRKRLRWSRADDMNLGQTRPIEHQADLLIQGVSNGPAVASDENFGVDQALRNPEIEIGDLGRDQSAFHPNIEKQVL